VAAVLLLMLGLAFALKKNRSLAGR
jgi:hypothetical protein